MNEFVQSSVLIILKHIFAQFNLPDVQQSPYLCYHCVPKKHSLAQNSLGRGLFYVVNVLLYFKIAQLRTWIFFWIQFKIVQLRKYHNWGQRNCGGLLYLTLVESYSRGVDLLIIYTRANSRLIIIARFRPFFPFKIQKTVSALRTI